MDRLPGMSEDGALRKEQWEPVRPLPPGSCPEQNTEIHNRVLGCKGVGEVHGSDEAE